MKVKEFAAFPFIIKQYNSLFKDLLEKHNMTQVEVDILAFLHNNPEYKYANDIVKIRGINKGHVSTGVEKLVNKQLLQRVPDPEKRRYNILFITDQAKSIVDEIVDIQQHYRKTVYDSISDEDYNTFIEVLNKMYRNLGGYYE